MILILSKTQNESTTDEVIDWLHLLKAADYFRINADDLMNLSLKLSVNDSWEFGSNDQLIELFQKAKVIWYRRWFEPHNIKLLSGLNAINSLSYARHINSEAVVLSKELFLRFADRKWIDHPANVVGLNKLQVLKFAKSCGLKVPETIVTNELAEVKEFLSSYSSIITKPISEVLHLDYNEYKFLTHTKVINSQNIDNLPARFFPSLFQQNIHKKFELRVFVLNDKLFSMAIFSQNDEMTMEDFRNYNRIKPNRYVPFLLPSHISESLLRLMGLVKLKSGSIDLIYTDKGEYFFLEINPIGQFGMVSKPCNYNLEKEMALFLIHLNNES